MNYSMLRVLARAIKKKAEAENKTVNEVLEKYTKISDEDKQKIKDYIDSMV